MQFSVKSDCWKHSSGGVCKKDVLKNFTKSQENSCVRISSLIKLQACSPATLLKSSSSTGVFEQISETFQEHIFCRTSKSGRFWIAQVKRYTSSYVITIAKYDILYKEYFHRRTSYKMN